MEPTNQEQMANIALALIERADIKGTEAEAVFHCKNWLRSFLTQQPMDAKNDEAVSA